MISTPYCNWWKRELVYHYDGGGSKKAEKTLRTISHQRIEYYQPGIYYMAQRQLP